MKKINWNEKASEKDYLIAILIFVGIAMLFFIYMNFVPKNFSKTYSIEIIEITGDRDLFNVSQLTSEFSGVEIKSQKKINYKEEEAKKLIKEYNIKKIPALIIKSKNIQNIIPNDGLFEVNKKSAVFQNSVPYYDLNSGETRGFVDFIEVQDSSCENCFPLSSIGKQFELFGIKTKNYEIKDISYEQTKELAEKNKLEFVPAILISKEIKEYWWIFDDLESSLVEREDYFVLDLKIPPYKDLKDNQIKGVVNLIYIEDKSCLNCFNVSELGESFKALGVFAGKEESFDISSQRGKEIINKYNITKIPTLVLSKEVLDYPNIREILESVGDFDEDDLSFVFRKLELIEGEYKEI